MPRRTWLLAHATLHVIAGSMAVLLADTYPRRISSPQGHFLVHTVDEGPRAAFDRPESVVVTVADGLGAEAAQHTRAVAWFRAHGRCFSTNVGSPSISRPVYAVLSSGVEQDRTGVRGNDAHDPAPVRSVWEEARDAGWHVKVVSSLAWWHELFPNGFDEYLELPQAADFFEQVRPHELDLLHVLYIDHAGHEQGAGSREYVDAVRRLDHEASAFIAKTNLDESLLVFTADHGHSIIGGHGGSDPRVATVLTCFAGKNVKPRSSAGHATRDGDRAGARAAHGRSVPAPHARRRRRSRHRCSRSCAPTTQDAALPRGPQAGGGEVPRAQPRAARPKMTGTVGSWDEFYRQRGRSQTWHWAVILGLLVVVLLTSFRALHLAWGLVTIAVITGAFWVTRGSFDLTAMTTRFLARTTVLWLTLGATSALLLGWLRGSASDALRMQATCTVVLLGVTLGHIAVYGLTLGFPIPPPTLLFLPYFSTVALAARSVLGARHDRLSGGARVHGSRAASPDEALELGAADPRSLVTARASRGAGPAGPLRRRWTISLMSSARTTSISEMKPSSSSMTAISAGRKTRWSMSRSTSSKALLFGS